MRRSKSERRAARVGHLGEREEEVLVYRGGYSVNAPLFLHVGLEPFPLLGWVRQFVECIRQFDPATVELEPLGDTRIVGTYTRERRLGRRVGMKNRRPPNSQVGFDQLAQEPAEDIRPTIVRRHAQAAILCLRSKGLGVGTAADRQAVVYVHAGVAQKRFPHGEPLRRLERTGLPTAKHEGPRSRDVGGERSQRAAVLDQALERGVGSIPLQHRKFGRVDRRSLAIAENAGQRVNPLLPDGQELLHREFGRSMQIGVARRAVRQNERCLEPVQVSLVSGRSLEGCRLHFDEILGVEPASQEARNPRPASEAGASRGVLVPTPERPRPKRDQEAPRLADSDNWSGTRLAFSAKIGMVRAKSPTPA